MKIYIYSDWVLLSIFRYAYHMRLIVQQTAILLELKDVNSPYPDHVPEQCSLEGNNALTINMRSIKHIMHYDRVLQLQSNLFMRSPLLSSHI
jgi:hypothetical protein